MTQTKQTVDVSKLSFADWKSISSACDNSIQWAFFKWIENSSQLKDVSRQEVKEIASDLGYSSGWVADKIEEYL